MGAYWLDERNQIQACLAHRIGKLAVQYDHICRPLPFDEQYDHTLCVSLLHTLLTCCLETRRARNHREATDCAILSVPLPTDEPVWGLTREMIVADTFVREEPSLDDVLEHMRHAVSHPTALDLSDDCPSTGYTATEQGDLIKEFVFVHSPDRRGKTYRRESPRLFVVKLPTGAMLPLVVGLSNYLAQPILKDEWDGKTIHKLVAA